MSERCRHDMIVDQCHNCAPRLNAVDLNPDPGSRSRPSGYAAEVTNTVSTAEGEQFDLVPSGGEAYIFGAGHGLHHRRECSEGGDTPPERVLSIPDPNGDLWRRVTDFRDFPRVDRLRNVDGGLVTVCCGVCALRPRRD